jgi:hypothetical protein
MKESLKIEVSEKKSEMKKYSGKLVSLRRSL